MNKTETKKYASMKKFFLKLEKYLQDPKYVVLWGGDTIQTNKLTFNDDFGSVSIVEENCTFCVFSVDEMWDVSVTRCKNEAMQDFVVLSKSKEWWK